MTNGLPSTPNMLDIITKAAAEKPIVGYFGYGSLVNEATLRTSYILSIPAALNGWHRAWDIPNEFDLGQQTISLLTARPDPDTTIDGSIIFDDAANLPDVDERERNYRRHPVEPDDLHLDDMTVAALQNIDCKFYVYEAIKSERPAPLSSDQRPPILQSYLDAVLQGFYKIYGEQGVYDFIHTTKNFDTPILRDRAAPKYPRSIDLSPSERNLIDYILTSRQDITFI